MSGSLIQKAKRAILHDISKALPGTNNLEIAVESHGGIEYFRQAILLPEVQAVLAQKRMTASIKEINPLSKVKDFILSCIANNRDKKEFVFQAFEKDADLYYAALKLLEVRQEIERKGLEVRVQVVNKFGNPKPDIAIATIDDVASGRLDDLL